MRHAFERLVQGHAVGCIGQHARDLAMKGIVHMHEGDAQRTLQRERTAQAGRYLRKRMGKLDVQQLAALTTTLAQAQVGQGRHGTCRHRPECGDPARRTRARAHQHSRSSRGGNPLPRCQPDACGAEQPAKRRVALRAGRRAPDRKLDLRRTSGQSARSRRGGPSPLRKPLLPHAAERSRRQYGA